MTLSVSSATDPDLLAALAALESAGKMKCCQLFLQRVVDIVALFGAHRSVSSEARTVGLHKLQCSSVSQDPEETLLI